MSEADGGAWRGVARGAAAAPRAGEATRPIEHVQVLDLPKISDPDGRGNLTFLEGGRHIPFPIKRVYYLYDVPGGESRGGHAHRELQQFIVAATGSFEVQLDDGHEKRTVFLNRSYYGVLVPKMVWRELHGFSSGSVCLVMASDYYDRSDYIYDYDAFLRAVRSP